MPFSAECPLCHLTLQSVPDHRLGQSVECPRCHNCFTPATEPRPEAAATQGPRLDRERIASTPPASAPGPGNGTLPPAGRQSSESDSITAEKAPADTAKNALAGPSTRHRLPPIEARSVRDYFGVGAFGLGSYAVLAGALTHERYLTLGLGLAGLLCGVVGLLLSFSKQQVSVLASAGLVLSLPAVLVAALAPDWLGVHLSGGPEKAVPPSGMSAPGLNGRSDLRRPAAPGTAPPASRRGRAATATARRFPAFRAAPARLSEANVSGARTRAVTASATPTGGAGQTVLAPAGGERLGPSCPALG